MTFTLQQTSLTATGTTTGGVTTLATVLPALSTAGSLLIATMQTGHGGTPFKCISQATAPGNFAGSAVGSGGTFAAGTYFWKITALTAAGETTASAEVSATLVLNGSASLTWSALPSFVTGIKVYRGTTTGNEDHLIATLGAVTSYTDTGTVGSVASPSAATTAGVPNGGPGWEFCGLAAAGTILQAEIWCYRHNPGGLSGVTFTNAAGAACRGTIQEWTTTKTWQVMDLFPGSHAVAGTGQPAATTNGQAGVGDLTISLLADHFTVNPTGQSWTAPSGWTLILSQANNLATPWAAYYKVAAAAGTVSITGNYSTSTNQDANAAVIVSFRETNAVSAPVGCSTSAGTYTDQATINPAQAYPANHTGSMQEFDFFIGRNCAQSAGVVYQSVEGDTVSSIPSGMNDIFNAGGLPHWALKPQRATSGAATTTEQGKVDTALTIAKQGGITGFTVSFWNEYNYGGANGPFGNDTTKNGGDPYGTGNTDATAKANWLAYWANFQPIAAQHGIPAYTKPTYASPSSVSSWHPPAGTVSGVVVDFYMADSVGKGVYLDQSPASGVPSLQDVCDGVRNPNNTTASNPPIALGIGEWGRAGGGSSNHTWAEVVAWSHNSTGTGHLRDFFAARLAAGKQNAAIMWFENNINGPNWIHTPGTNGEDQTAIQAEIRACVDALTVSQITGGNPVITTTSPLPGGQVGIPYSASLAASGGTTPYTWSVTTGRLPEGLTLNASTGQITGSPQAIETVSTGFTVTDAASLTGTATLSTTISPAGLFVPPQTPPAGRVSSPYAMSLIAQGGTPPYTWAVTSGSLPTGLTLAAGGTISGTPSVAGGFSFTVTVTDHASATASLPLTITIATAASLTITTPLTLQSGASGFSYSATLAAIGGTPPYTWAVTSGALPPGLVLSSAGVISGTPIATSSSPVTYSLTITVTDSLSATAPGVFTITIFTIQPTPLPIGPWRFLYGPTQFNGTGGVTAEVIQAQNKTVLLRHEPDQTHEVSFDVDGRSQAAQDIVELENDLIVTFGNEIVFDGRIVPTMDTLTASAHRTQVTAYDYREVLRRRALLPGDTVSWSNVDVSTIAWNMIQATQGHPGGNLGIVRGVGQTTGILRTYTANVGDYIGDDITSLALLDNGFDWQITPYGFSDLRLDIFAPDMNRDTGLVLSYGDGRIASITRTVDPTTFANCVYVTSSGGTGTLTPQHLEAPTIATDPAGHWTSVIGTTDNTQSVLNDHALALLNELQVVTPSYQVVLHPGAWEGPDSLWFGDNITLRIDSGRLFIDEQLQVVEMAFSISPDNVETLTLTLGQIPFRLPKKIASILKRLRYLDTR